MRRVALYLVCLSVAAALVFSATYFLGRHSSLEAELERLSAPRVPVFSGKSKGIPSLQPVETPTEPPAAAQQPAGEPLGEGIVAVRSPLEPPGLVVVADLPALGQASGPDGSHVANGLAAFFSRPPAGLKVGVRALAGSLEECGADRIKEPAAWPDGELWRAVGASSGAGLGPRNPAGAVRGAAEDLAPVTGERAVVVVAGGEAACEADFCGAAPPPGGSSLRVHVLLLAQAPESAADSGMPNAGSAGTLQPVFDPPWGAAYRCLAERSGGTFAAVSTAAELESSLRRIAADLEASVVVKGFHYTGQEVKGISPGGEAGWGASLRVGRGAGDRTLEADLLPAQFAVPSGVHVIKARYAGQERTAAVAVAAGERGEVRVTFSTGELFVQAYNGSGGEIVGDSTGFRCAWGVDVLMADGEDVKKVAGSCSFPARVELGPGIYRVRARWKGIERDVEEVTIEAGANVLRAVSFGAATE